MMKKISVVYFVLLALLLAACSIDVSDEPTNTPRPVDTEAAPAATADQVATEEPAATPEAEANENTTDGEPAVQTPAEEAPTEVPATREPPPWADLDLGGTLYYVGFVGEQQTLLRLDLLTGEQTTIFDPPENAWLTDIAVSPDGSQIAMTYATPPEEGVQFGFTDLYVMPADGSAEPTPLLLRAEASETYFNVSWPLDGHIYYAHFTPTPDDLGALVYSSQVERVSYPDGTVEVLATTAAWPRLSEDGSKLAYVTDDNEFIVAGPDGSDPVVVLPPEAYPAVDAPLFSPDSAWLYFSAIEPETASLFPFFDWLLGVKVAEAHSVPSDWWRMPADGSGDPERLTNIYEIGMYGDFSPDGTYLGFITSSGVQIMNPDGTGIFRLRNVAATGTINWVP